ncbi:MAG TPA: response regulator [Stellaceae bacterium]|nr:response regulator [Stellaceae bacterium]
MSGFNTSDRSTGIGIQRPGAAGPARQFLFVDDNVYIAQAIQRVAGSCGLEVRLATTAGSFCQRYQELTPDLIGFDLAMPGGDGIELIRFLAAQNCRAPILIITGHDQRVLAAAARLGRERGLNIVETLSKPFSVETLKTALEHLVEAAIIAGGDKIGDKK